MNQFNFNVTAMNYGELEELAKTIGSNGETIYDALLHIKQSFMKMRDAGFAGATLTAVLGTLDKIQSLPEDVKENCQTFEKYANQAVEEVKVSENQVLNFITSIIESDPKTYELPDWYKMDESYTGNSDINIDNIQ